MRSNLDSYSAEARAHAKQRSRARDESALASGRKAVGELKSENEVFAQFAHRASLNISASRSLA
jgi:hypothetical protein